MTTSKVGEFCWNELATSNVQAAKDFYGTILGWTFTEKDVGDMTYTMISTGAEEFGGMWQIPNDQKDTIPPHWMSYITVQNLESVLKQAESLGATVKMPITPVSTYGRFAVIIDPTGAHIALWESLE